MAVWQPAFDLTPPFVELPTVFRADQVARQDETLRRMIRDNLPSAATGAPNEFTLAKCGPQAQLEATFDRSWEQATTLGLALNATSPSVYSFVIRPADAKKRESKLSGIAAAGEQLAAEIRKGDVALRRVVFPAADICGKELTLRVERDRTRLVFQINESQRLEVDDLFSRSASEQGVFALHWPGDVRLVRLRALRKTTPTNPSPLERGDELFDAGQFAEALAQYQQQTAQSAGSEFSQEARYKQGLCLLALNRVPDAAALFEPLYLADGERWPALAGCQLWLMRLREKRHDAADVLFQTLSSRFQFRDLLVLLPQDLRSEILKEYREGYRDFSYQLSLDPKRLERLKRAVEMEAELVDDPIERAKTKKELLRAYRMQGNLNEAIRIAETLLRDAPESEGYLYEYTWLLRLRRTLQDLALAMTQVNKLLLDAKGELNLKHVGLLVERARIHTAMNAPVSALRDLDEYLSHASDYTNNSNSSYYGSAAYLLRGFLHAQAQDHQEALESWHDGASRAAEFMEKSGGASHSTLLRFSILGSLAGELADRHTLWIVDKLVGSSEDNLLSAIVRELPTTPAERSALCGVVIRNMWRSQRGLQYMEKFARQSNTLIERYQFPMVLALAEIASEFAFDGLTTAEEDELLWDIADQLHTAFATGQLGKAHIRQLFAAWQGVTDINGWAGLSEALNPPLRGTMAYVLAMRWLKLNRVDDARRLLPVASQFAKPKSSLEQLAKSAVSRLQADKGRVVVERSTPRELKLSFLKEGSDQAIEFQASHRELELEPGRYQLKLVNELPDTWLTSHEVTVSATRRSAVSAVSLWEQTDDSRSWPGFIPRPSKLPGIERWQVCLKYPANAIRAMSQSPDGRMVAVGAFDSVIRIYNVETGAPTAILLGHKNEIQSLKWSRDGQLLASGSRDGSVRIWDVATGKQQNILRSFHGATCIAWHPNGLQVAVGTWSGVIHLRTVDGKSRQLLRGHQGQVLNLSWHPDGKRLMSSGFDNTIQLWQLDENSGPTKLAGDKSVRSAKWSPDGKRIAASVNNAATIWESSSMQVIHTFPAAKGLFTELAWSPNGKLLSAASHDGHLRIWDAEGMNDDPVALKQLWSPEYVDWGANAKSFVTADSNGLIRVWNPDATVIREIGTPSRAIAQIAFQPKGNLLATACANGNVWLIDSASPRAVQLTGSNSNATGIAWSEDGAQLSASFSDKMVRSWNVSDGRLESTRKGHTGGVNCLAMAPGGGIVSVAVGGEAISWQGASGEFEVIGKPTGNPKTVSVSSQGEVAVAADLANVWLWRPSSEPITWKVPQGTIRSAAWNPKASKLAIAWDNKVAVMNWGKSSPLERCLTANPCRSPGVGPARCWQPPVWIQQFDYGTKTVPNWRCSELCRIA